MLLKYYELYSAMHCFLLICSIPILCLSNTFHHISELITALELDRNLQLDGAFGVSFQCQVAASSLRVSLRCLSY